MSADRFQTLVQVQRLADCPRDLGERPQLDVPLLYVAKKPRSLECKAGLFGEFAVGVLDPSGQRGDQIPIDDGVGCHACGKTASRQYPRFQVVQGRDRDGTGTSGQCPQLSEPVGRRDDLDGWHLGIRGLDRDRNPARGEHEEFSSGIALLENRRASGEAPAMHPRGDSGQIRPRDSLEDRQRHQDVNQALPNRCGPTGIARPSGVRRRVHHLRQVPSLGG
jgi:hypothetical protein